jgi:hypothetical protein
MAQAKMETIRNRNGVVINMPGQPSIEVTIPQLSDDIQRQLALHGLAQKLVDAAARLRNPDTGAPAPWDEKHRMVRRVADALLAGDWTLRPEKIGADAITADRVQAVADARKLDTETVRAWLNDISAAQRTLVFAHPSVMVALAAIRAARATTDEDHDPFAGLDDNTDPDEAPF